MVDTTARIKKAGKNFEILVDLDQALKFKKEETNELEIQGDKIFRDSKKGMSASKDELESAFGTADIDEIAKRIIKEGEVLVTQEYRDEEKERKRKQIVDFLSKNAIDPQSGNPHSSERIKNALEQANINIKNAPVESQIKEILEKLSKIVPITIKTKKVKITIPAIHTGKAYGLLNQYKGEENWLNDGSLEVTVNVPVGAIMEFYDKLNSVTHGSAQTEEVKE